MIENGYCELDKECKYKDLCGNPVYIIPGYREKDMEYDNNIKFADWTFDYHDTYKCFLPYNKCEHDVECIADELNDILEDRGETQPIDLVGLCFGGNVAMQYAAKHKDKVDNLALVSTNDMKRVNMLTEAALDIRDIENVKNTDFKAIANEVEADTFIYNCFSDRILGGNPPNIKGAEVREDIFCIHGQLNPSLKNIVETFLDHH